MDKDLGRGAAGAALGEKSRADSLAGAPVSFIAHGTNGQVNLAGMGTGAGGNGVEPRLELAQKAHEVDGRQPGLGPREHDVDDVLDCRGYGRATASWLRFGPFKDLVRSAGETDWIGQYR